MINDVSIPAALIAGLVSFLSPCVLPLVPPYLIYLTGATIEHVANDETTEASKRAVMTSALMFVLGFSTVFVALGAAVQAVGQNLADFGFERKIPAGVLTTSYTYYAFGTDAKRDAAHKKWAEWTKANLKK